jgi:hypothetical protein
VVALAALLIEAAPSGGASLNSVHFDTAHPPAEAHQDSSGRAAADKLAKSD